jgi:hypothetical protein
VLGGLTSAVLIVCSSSVIELEALTWYGLLPESSSYSTTPKEYTSVAAPIGSSLVSSGLA